MTSAPLRHQTYPITYIRAFAYHPVAFPQPLAPITTYHVRNPQQTPILPSKTGFQSPRGVPGFPTISKSDSPSSYGLSTHQQLPQGIPSDFGAPTTTTTTTSTTTTTPAPTTTAQPQPPPFVASQQAPMMNTRAGFDGYQRQMFYGGNNFGGYPQFYSQPYNPYPYVDQSVGNQFTGRVYNGGEPNYQQYTTDSVTYQFVPTSITPIQQPQNSVKFVPCMCPVAVSVSAPIPEKRSDEIPLPTPQQSDETPSQPLTSSSKLLDEIDMEESK